jgi:hypothetical protein
VNRTELRQLAEDRILDAAALLAPASQRWSGAYYLAGYAVECGLKSCVLAHVERTGVIFKERKFLENCWTHDLKILVKSAGLESQFGQARSASPGLDLNWATVTDWSEESRYEQKNQIGAEELYEAITNNNDGVMQWIRIHW